MNTTRKYPRTLNEAFPHTAEYGCALTVYRRSPLRHMIYAAAWITLLLCTLAAFGGKS